ncbi:MAG: TetR/AcrR family transcriptional regulator [Janthinobacterium lividum]
MRTEAVEAGEGSRTVSASGGIAQGLPADTPRRRKPRSGAVDVRAALQAAALELFAEQNYSTVTIKDIARHTGINTGLIYYYFKSKEDLFLNAVEATAEAAFDKFEAVRTSAPTPEAIISIWIEIHVLHFVLLRKLAKVSLDYASTANRTPRIDRAIRRFYDKESVVLGEAIRIGTMDGTFRDVDPKRMSAFISTFLDGCLFRSVMFPKFSYRNAMDDLRVLVLDSLRARTARNEP